MPGLGDRLAVKLRWGWKREIVWGKGDRLDFGLGECNGSAGYPRGERQLDIWDWGQKVLGDLESAV